MKLNLKNGQGEIYTLDRRYERILDINFTSKSDEDIDDHKCYIGCRVKDLRQIKIIKYDFLKQANF